MRPVFDPRLGKRPELGMPIAQMGSLQVGGRKLYRRLPDKRAARDGFLRIVDESRGDYLYPEFYFATIRLPRKAQKAVAVCG